MGGEGSGARGDGAATTHGSVASRARPVGQGLLELAGRVCSGNGRAASARQRVESAAAPDAPRAVARVGRLGGAVAGGGAEAREQAPCAEPPGHTRVAPGLGSAGSTPGSADASAQVCCARAAAAARATAAAAVPTSGGAGGRTHEITSPCPTAADAAAAAAATAATAAATIFAIVAPDLEGANTAGAATATVAIIAATTNANTNANTNDPSASASASAATLFPPRAAAARAGPSRAAVSARARTRAQHAARRMHDAVRPSARRDVACASRAQPRARRPGAELRARLRARLAAAARWLHARAQRGGVDCAVHRGTFRAKLDC